MAALNDTRIITKSSGAAGEVPTQADLYIGELAVNLADRKIYTRNVAGQIIELGGTTGPILPDYDPLFQIVAVDTTATGIYSDTFPKTLQVPPEVQEGDLAVVFLFMRSDLDSTLETIGVTQAQLTPLIDQQEFAPGSSVTSGVSYRSWSGDVDAALIASGIEITADNPSADFWYTIYYIRNGEIVTDSASAQDTTASSGGQSSPSSGGQVIGESVLPGNIALVAAHNLYAYADNSGVDIVEDEADITVIRGPLFAEGVQRRNTAYIVSEGDYNHRIRATNTSNSPSSLTDGFHVMRVDVRGKATVVTSVNGQTGIVSLGIQDMDDFELSGAPESITRDPYDFSDPFAFPPGTWTTSDSGNGPSLLFSVQGTSGSDADFFAKINTASNLRVLHDGNQYDLIPTNIFNDQFGRFYFRIPQEVYDPIHNNGNRTGQLSLLLLDEVLSDPLAEGDILQWNDSDQKFKPATPQSLFTEVDGGTFGSG